MAEQEAYPIGVGSNFGLEVSLFQTCEGMLASDGYIQGIAETVAELNTGNPYVGRQVIFDVAEPIKLISDINGQELELRPNEDPTFCKIIGFHPIIEDIGGILTSELGVELAFESISYLQRYAGLVRATSIYNMELEKRGHPFIYEQNMFGEAVRLFANARALHPTADIEDYLDEAAEQLDVRMTAKGSEVEILVADLSRLHLRRRELVPYWVADFDEIDQEPDSENADEFAENEDETLIDFRGTFRGEAVGFDYVYDDDGTFDLILIVALNPQNDLTDDPGFRYAYVGCGDISWGRIITGPACN